MRGQFLRHGDHAPSGHRRLKSVRPVATPVGPIGKMRTEHPALASVFARRRLASRQGQTHTQAGGRPTQTSDPGGAKSWPNSPLYPIAKQLAPSQPGTTKLFIYKTSTKSFRLMPGENEMRFRIFNMSCQEGKQKKHSICPQISGHYISACRQIVKTKASLVEFLLLP